MECINLFKEACLTKSQPSGVLVQILAQTSNLLSKQVGKPSEMLPQKLALIAVLPKADPGSSMKHVRGTAESWREPEKWTAFFNFQMCPLVQGHLEALKGTDVDKTGKVVVQSGKKNLSSARVGS